MVTFDSEGSASLIMNFKLDEDGRIKQYDHIESGWIAYAPGQKPSPNLEITQKTEIIYAEDDSIKCITTDLEDEDIMRNVHYIMKDRRLVEQRTSTYRKGQIKKAYGEAIFAYDSKTQLIEIKRSLHIDGLSRSSGTLFERDSDGRIISRSHILDTSAEADREDNIIRTNFKYDDDDRLVKAVSYRKLKEIGWELHQYEFIGEHLTARIMKRADGSSHIETRHEFNEQGLLSRRIIKHEELREETIHSYEYAT